MQEVEFRLEQKSRAMQEQLPRQGCRERPQEVEFRLEQESRAKQGARAEDAVSD